VIVAISYPLVDVSSRFCHNKFLGGICYHILEVGIWLDAMYNLLDGGSELGSVA